MLWFDEYYDEEHYRFESSVAAAADTDLLIIAGTSGATTLPNHVATIVYENGNTIIDINIEENPFSQLARDTPDGMFIQASSAKVLPMLAELCGR